MLTLLFALSALGGPTLGEREVLLQCEELVLTRRRWKADGQRGWLWEARVPRDRTLDVVPGRDDLEPLAQLAPTDDGPWVAVNGGFYRGGPMGLVVSDGHRSAELSAEGGSGVIEASRRGVAIVHRDDWEPFADEALQSIDRLVVGGEVVVGQEGPGAARSAVALSEEGMSLVVAVDRRSASKGPDQQLVATEHQGPSLRLFAELLAAGGAVDALNLDGGRSTALSVRGCGGQLELRGEGDTVNAVVLRPTNPIYLERAGLPVQDPVQVQACTERLQAHSPDYEPGPDEPTVAQRCAEPYAFEYTSLLLFPDQRVQLRGTPRDDGGDKPVPGPGSWVVMQDSTPGPIHARFTEKPQWWDQAQGRECFINATVRFDDLEDPTEIWLEDPVIVAIERGF